MTLANGSMLVIIILALGGIIQRFTAVDALFHKPSIIRTSTLTSPTRLLSATSNTNGLLLNSDGKYLHGMAILKMPDTSIDRIANDAILETALQHTKKLSVVLRSSDGHRHSLASLRRYVGEIYSSLWDASVGQTGDVASDVLVYAQNLPNTASEQWVHNRPDLGFVCSHESVVGWSSDFAGGRGIIYDHIDGSGVGGLQGLVEALNSYRLGRGLTEVEALPVLVWPKGACPDFLDDNHVLFMDDDALEKSEERKEMADAEDDAGSVLLGGARISQSLFNGVAVGGTFDGLHCGHRKLLTLAISSVQPQSGKLLIGVTTNEMLKHKKLAELIPSVEERVRSVKDFIYQVAPGMKNRLVVEPITDPYGPPGSAERADEFDALVLSHETLETGHLLNLHRVHKLGAKPLVLLCTRRSEPHGMSSTTLRKLRSLQQSATEKIR